MQAPPPTYTSGEDAITRSLDVVKESTPSSLAELDDAFDITWTASVIEERNYSRIALQFPDELLHISVPVYSSLKAKLAPSRQLYVLADTTYGSCCVDEVAAQHVEAEAVVHYGHACLKNIATELKAQLPNINVITHPISRLAEPRSTSPNAPSSDPAEPYSPFMKRIPETYTIFYVGGESLALNNLLLTHSSSQVWSYDPSSRETKLESVKTNRFLMRRYAVMQKACDADVFGILIGTLGA
ncbi:Diphthamide biosynthesis protein 2, partial [Tulasnella sp. 427]